MCTAILGRQSLDARAREMAILRVAAVTGAEYDWVQHGAIGRHVGLSRCEIEAARDGRIDGLDIALHFALEVGESIATESSLPTKLLGRCLGWFGEEETVEVVLIAGY